MGKSKYLIKELESFLERIQEEIPITDFILFGSRAGSEFDKDSDVDLIIVSDYFEGMNFFERVARVYDYWEIDLPVDFLCYTTKEFNKLKNQISIVSEALKKGRVIEV